MEILEILDRTLTEHLRLKMVAMGFLPDVTFYAGNLIGFEAAKDAIRNDPNKFLVEVFGVGNNDEKGELQIPRITIKRLAKETGDIAAFPEIKFEKYKDELNRDRYRKLQYPEKTMDVPYQVRVFTNTTKQDRLLSAAIEEVLGLRRSIPSIKDDLTLTGPELFIEYQTEANVGNLSIKETVYEYIIKDVWIHKFKEISIGIVPITKITVNATDDKFQVKVGETEV